MEPRTTLALCQKCTLPAHTACYGIAEDADLEEWLCELCDAAESEKKATITPVWATSKSKPASRLQKPLRSLDCSCIACPEFDPPDRTEKEKEKEAKEAMTALDVLKMTEQNQ